MPRRKRINLERFSVKKPFTILVAAIIIIAMGAVSLWKLQMDLLPEISLPYLIVVTAYPGASPEKVEDQLTVPLENSLGTISGVKNVVSTSAENYSMIQLEFVDGTDMNTAMVRVSSAINQIESSLPSGTSTPNIMEISMDMLATMYVAVEVEGYDQYQLSDFVNNDVIPYISRQDGVASINTIGLVEKTVLVELNNNKINYLNDRILAKTDDKLAEAQRALDEAKEQLDDAQSQLDDAQSSFGSQMSSAIFSQLNGRSGGMADGLKNTIATLVTRLSALRDGLAGLKNTQDTSIASAQEAVDNARARLETALALHDQMSTTVAEAQEVLDNAIAALEAYTSDPDADQTTAEYLALVQAVSDARTALEEATAAYGESSAEVEAAQAALDEAVNALTAATIAASGSTPEQIDALIADINTLIAMLQNISTNIDGSSFPDLVDSTRQLASVLAQISALLTRVQEADPAGSLSAMIARVSTSLSSASGMLDSIPQLLSGLQTMVSGLTQGQLDAAVGFATAATQLSDAQTQLDAAQAQYDSARETALKNANADALISPQTLSQLIYAQNFSMPVGYIDDENDNSWLLRVGEEFADSDELASALLIDNELIGTIRLSDIADITVIDDSGESYAKLNGNETAILCIYKSSSTGTNDVSKACNKAFKELEEKYPDMHCVNLMDQGDYITMIVESVFQSMIFGAILAIVVLAIFLGDFKPTIVVAISIPLSVLLAIALMYFTGLQLNVMTLSGLSLGIGMLVDNSVVVMENIFRLRGLGMSAPRAAVQGAKQVRGAIVASTLTTVCVFLPAVFASGTVRTLLYPMAMSIGFCLVASLAVAMTVVPASSSTLMKNTKPKEHKIFDKIQNGYGKSLNWCLKFKIVPLVLAIGLLAFSIWEVFRLGIVYIPDIITNEVQITISTPDDMTREESYEEVDQIIDRLLAMEGIDDIGAMDSSSTLSFFGAGLGGSSSSYGSYTVSVLAPEGTAAEDMYALADRVEDALKDFPGTIKVSASQMMDMSAMTGGSGYSVKIFGKDFDELERISNDVREIFESQDGLTDVKDSFAEGADTLQVVIDRDKAMQYGLTVAQIYAGIAAHTRESVTATTITVNGTQMNVEIVDDTDTLTKEELMDVEFEEVDMTSMASSSSASMSSMSSMGSMSSMSMEDMAAMMGQGSSADTSEDVADEEDQNEEDENTTHKLSEFAEVIETKSSNSLNRENLTHYVTVSSKTMDGYNTTLLSREIQPKIDEYSKTLPAGYSIEVDGESTQVMEMVTQMVEMAALALLFIYLIMVAQFQSLLSPFIILFTIPLAFTGGMLGLVIGGIQLSMLSLLGFVILMGTVVNNGIVFVDYVNQLRIGGMERWDALVATGKTRMRPILMTALTTILAMSMMIFGTGMASQLGRGMAIVIAGGLLYATFMTLYIVPVMYDIFFKKQPLNVDVGDDMDDAIDDAAQFLKEREAREEANDDTADKESRTEGSGESENSSRPGGSSAS